MAFPESERWACDGVALDTEEALCLRDMLNEWFQDDGAFTIGGIEN